MRWLWPISWYWRIRDLQEQVAALKARKRELEAQVRAQAIEQIAMMATYTAAVASITATIEKRHGSG